MIKLHHLNNSRSQRILWLLEELELDYEIIKYQRDATTNLAPPELKEIHPLGKSPVLEDGDIKIAESGAIVDYLARTYGKGEWAPEIGTAEYEQHNEWVHFAEGSAMLPFLMALYANRLGVKNDLYEARYTSEILNFLTYMNDALEGQTLFGGDKPSAADIMLSFVVDAAGSSGLLPNFPNLDALNTAMRARPAYQKALEKGGEYALGK